MAILTYWAEMGHKATVAQKTVPMFGHYVMFGL